MRRKPVTREEVRFNGTEIITVPADAVVQQEWRVSAIPALFAPLLRTLNAQQRRQWRHVLRTMPERTVVARRAGIRGRLPAPPPPLPIGLPRLHLLGTAQSCSQCGRKFFRAGNAHARYCSDTCAAAGQRKRWAKANATRVAKRSAQRREARDGKRCRYCGKPLTAARSTKRFCSIRCRVGTFRWDQRNRPRAREQFYTRGPGQRVSTIR